VGVRGVDIQGGFVEHKRLKRSIDREMSGVVMCGSAGLLPAAAFRPSSRDFLVHVAPHDSEFGQQMQRFQPARPSRMLECGFCNVSHSVIKEESDGLKEELIRPHGQRI
jgi:hypothetical protein